MSDLFDEEKDILNSGELFGHYEIISELGRGGMGVVYKVFDTNLKIIVALKLILQSTARTQQRFLLESNAMAKFEHPNIARIYEIETHPRPYFTMEYVDGITLAESILNKKIKSSILIKIMIKVCNALHKIHSEGILHRDLKPSNIMIDKSYEPKIMDFGLAKFSDEELHSLSKSGAIIGTLSYMAPEQIQGKETEKSDIYSIGACFYEALTYRSVYQGDTDFNIIYQILHSSPIPPRELNPDISPYLEAICLKCLSKKQHNRYKNFRELVQEFKNYENNRPIIAKKYTAWRKLQQQMQKHVVFFTSLGIIFIITCIIFSVAYIKVQNENHKVVEISKRLQQEKREFEKMINAIIESLSYSIEKHQDLLTDEAFRSPIIEILQQTDRLELQEKYFFLRSLISYKNKDFEKSLEQLRLFHEQNSPNYDSYSNLGVTYFHLKQYQKAIENLDKAILLNDKKSLVYYYKSRCLFELKKYEQAIIHLDKAIQMNNKNYSYYHCRGQAFFRMNNYKLALFDYNRAINLNDSNHIMYYDRGTTFLKQKRYDKAEEDFKRSLQIKPKQTSSYFNLAFTYREKRNLDEAIEEYTKLLKINNKSYRTYEERGITYFDLKDYQKAIDDWQEALKLSNKNTYKLTENIRKARLHLLNDKEK